MYRNNLKAAGLLLAACLIGGATTVVLGQPPEPPKKPAPVPKQAEAKGAAIKALQERLQGTWKCVALHTAGVKCERDLTCTIRGSSWETRLDGRVYQSGTLKLGGLDASPRHIDWVITSDAIDAGEQGKTYHGIFLLDGDSLCCVNSDAAASPRPQVFFTEPNDGCYAAMYKRVATKQGSEIVGRRREPGRQIGWFTTRKAAGGVLTAKQAPRRPGTAPAPGLRAWCVVPPIVPQTARSAS